MWPEPLTARTTRIAPDTVVVTTSDGDGNAVARVTCIHGDECGYFGEMTISKTGGLIRQKRRALVLLVREALRYADELGLVQVSTEAPPALRAFAFRMAGVGLDDGHVAGPLHQLRTHNLDHTNDQGEEL